jgi:hypothetical protein
MQRIFIAIIVGSLVLLLNNCASNSKNTSPSLSLQSIASPVSINIINGGFELWSNSTCPDSWACGQHTLSAPYLFVQDATGHFEGKSSLAIERREPGDWAKVSQSVSVKMLNGKRVRFSAMVKRDKVTGAGGLVLIASPDGYSGLEGLSETPYKSGSNAWVYESIEVTIPANISAMNIGFALEGSGKIWFDDAKLELLAPQ